MIQKILKFILGHLLYILVGILIFVPVFILGEKNNLAKHMKLAQLKLLGK